MTRTFCGLALAALLSIACGADWPRFLGPEGNNIAPDGKLPQQWSATQNVVWKTAMPGFGASSAITCGNQIFLTAYSGYATNPDDPGNQEDLTYHLLCVDATTGKIAWSQKIKADLPEQKYGGFIALHGYASSTPVTDGKTVYAFFGRTGVFAYTMDGKKLWEAKVGETTHGWGSGTSPLLVDDLVIVNASVESESLVALNKTTGKEIWRVTGIKDSWSTPGFIELAGGKRELVVSLHSKVLGIDPKSGEKLWECAGVPDYVCPAVVCKGDVAIVSGGRKPFTMAIRGGGRGDVTTTHKLWEINKTCKVPSPVWCGDLLHWVSDAGIACCVQAADGKIVYEERLAGLGKIYATPLATGERLIVFSREKGAVVLAAGREFKELARYDLGDESVFNATPVPQNGRMLIRSDKFLYCIGE